MDKNLKNIPVGFSVLRYFYLINVFLLGITLLIFYRIISIIVLGAILPPLSTIITEWLLILFPLYIYVDLKRPNPRVFFVILCYHFFFIANSILIVIGLLRKSFGIIPLLQVVDKYQDHLDVSSGMGYTIKHINIHGLSFIISFAILFYILRNINLFFKRSNK